MFSIENSTYLFLLCYLTSISLSTPSTVGVGMGLSDGGVFGGRGERGMIMIEIFLCNCHTYV